MVAPVLIAAGISAGTSLLSGLLSAQANAQQAAQQRQAATRQNTLERNFVQRQNTQRLEALEIRTQMRQEAYSETEGAATVLLAARGFSVNSQIGRRREQVNTLRRDRANRIDTQGVQNASQAALDQAHINATARLAGVEAQASAAAAATRAQTILNSVRAGANLFRSIPAFSGGGGGANFATRVTDFSSSSTIFNSHNAPRTTGGYFSF